MKSLEYLCHQSTQQPRVDYSAILLGYSGLYSVSNKPNGIEIGLLLYGLWQIWRIAFNWKRVLPI